MIDDFFWAVRTDEDDDERYRAGMQGFRGDRFDCTFGQCEERPDFREQTGGDPQTARRLNYFPNSSASNLARGRSKTIGVVINDIRNSHIAELDTAISEVLQERGYSVVNHIFNDKNEGRLDELIRRIASENLCALVGAKSMEPEKQTRTGCFMRP